jgi:SAM-dependent methyltransferase
MMAQTARSAAEVIVPLVLEHVRPRSVVDYGCGTGDWLAVFREHGVEEVLGVDGPWVDPDRLAIAPSEFLTHDLQEPVMIGREFDLAVCLEVVGHVAPQRESVFIDTLRALAPVILFSAPIPHQPGVGEGPFNNRWPKYWAQRFAERGMVSVDCLRLRVWEDPRVIWWYAQDIYFFVREDSLAGLASLRRERQGGPATPLPLVHPGLLEVICDPGQVRQRRAADLARGLPTGIADAIRSLRRRF